MAETTSLTPEQLAARTQRALAAATAAGREFGLTVTDAKIIHDVFSVVVELAPSPVVVRVPVVLPDGLDLPAQAARQSRELSAVAWLAEHGQPVVRPSPLVPRAPVQRDGFSMTFWELVDVDAQVVADYDARAPLVAKLHAALRDYPAPLPFLASVATSVPTGLAYLERHPDLLAESDLERAQREWRSLAPLFTSRAGFAVAFPDATLQAIHGDSPSYNVIDTRSGPLYADFEDVTLGPIEWDLTLQSPPAADAYDAAATRAGTRPLDRDLLRVMDVARMLQVVACFALVPQLPMLAAGLAPSLECWRQMPFAGGLTTRS